MSATRSITVSDPASEPISLSEAKQHLDIAAADTSHDPEVRRMITASRQQWEHDTQSLTVSRSVVEKLNTWPDETWRFYHRPVSAITSITYYDAANASQTLASSIYDLDIDNRKIYLAVDQTYPDLESRWDAVTVTYTAGQSTVDEIAKHAIKLAIDIQFELKGMTKEKDSAIRAYENLVMRYKRASYP